MDSDRVSAVACGPHGIDGVVTGQSDVCPSRIRHGTRLSGSYGLRAALGSDPTPVTVKATPRGRCPLLVRVGTGPGESEHTAP